MKKKLVLKIGTSTLTNGTKLISRGKIEDIGRQILELRDEFEGKRIRFDEPTLTRMPVGLMLTIHLSPQLPQLPQLLRPPR